MTQHRISYFSDKTLNVVQWQIVDFKWCDDFSAARNYAKRFAVNDLILSIDADEVLGGTFTGNESEAYWVRLE